MLLKHPYIPPQLNQHYLRTQTKDGGGMYRIQRKEHLGFMAIQRKYERCSVCKLRIRGDNHTSGLNHKQRTR